MGKQKNDNKIRTGLGYLLRNFTKKHRVSVRDRELEQEVWYMYISPMRMVLAVLGVLLVMFAVVVTAVVYTPILDTLPGYPGKKAREILLANIERIDSLEYSLRIMQAYREPVGLSLEGTPPAAGRPTDRPGRYAGIGKGARSALCGRFAPAGTTGRRRTVRPGKCHSHPLRSSRPAHGVHRPRERGGHLAV